MPHTAASMRRRATTEPIRPPKFQKGICRRQANAASGIPTRHLASSHLQVTVAISSGEFRLEQYWFAVDRHLLREWKRPAGAGLLRNHFQIRACLSSP